MESAGLWWTPVNLLESSGVQWTCLVEKSGLNQGVRRNMAYSGRLHCTGLANLACVTLKKSG